MSKTKLTPEERLAKEREYRRNYMANRRKDPIVKAKNNENSKRYYQEKRTDPNFREKVNADNLKRYYEKYRPSPEAMEKRRIRVAGYQRKRRAKFQERRQQLQQILGGKCIDCGTTDWRLLDFDHKDPMQKLMNISQYLHLQTEDLLPEVMKCELRCPNCHRIKTIERVAITHTN